MKFEIRHEDRDEIRREAEAVRSHLLSTIDVLDRRRHEATDVGLQVRRQVRRHPGILGAIAGALLLGVGASLWAGIAALRSKDRRKRRQRLDAVSRTWQHPERLARGAHQGIFAESGRKILVGLLTFAGAEIGKRLLRQAARRATSAHALPAGSESRREVKRTRGEVYEEQRLLGRR